jgi:hypothetical protein
MPTKYTFNIYGCKGKTPVTFDYEWKFIPQASLNNFPESLAHPLHLSFFHHT